jgi:hypothetical protein
MTLQTGRFEERLDVLRVGQVLFIGGRREFADVRLLVSGCGGQQANRNCRTKTKHE